MFVPTSLCYSLSTCISDASLVYYVARTASPTNRLRRILHRERTSDSSWPCYLFLFDILHATQRIVLSTQSTLRVTSMLCSTSYCSHSNSVSLNSHSPRSCRSTSSIHSINKFMSLSLRSHH